MLNLLNIYVFFNINKPRNRLIILVWKLLTVYARMFAVTAILSCIIKIRGLFKSTKWRHFENVKFEALSARRVSNDLTKWRNQKYFSMWQSRAWETGKSGMSYINENSFSRWIEKSEGLTTLRLQKLSESVRDYAYLILMSQTSTRGSIVGHEA